MALLSKYAHMAVYLQRLDGEKFMKSELYADTMASVTNAFISLAKQQKLGPHLPFFLFLLGSDGVEKLFACLRMLGGHNPNFNIVELGIRLRHAMDLVRIFEQYPEWHAGLKRLDISSEHLKVDHLTTHGWDNDVTAGNVTIPGEWLHGQGHGTGGLVRALRIAGVDWKKFWAVPGSNIQCPMGNSQYVGVDLLDADESDPMHLAVKTLLPEDEDPSALLLPGDGTPGSASGVGGSASGPPAEFNKSKEDAAARATTLEQLRKVQAHSTFWEGKCYHNATLVRLIFNDSTHHHQSKDRLVRVQMFVAPAVSSQLKLMAKDSCMIGDRVATAVQVGKKAYMALVQIMHLYQAGPLLYGVPRSELSVPELKIELHGQVLDLQPSILSTTEGPVLVYMWSGGMVKLRPASGLQAANDVFTFKFALSTATDLSPLSLHPSSMDNLIAAATLALGGLVFDSTKLNILATDISRAWSASTEKLRKLFACHPSTLSFPYLKHNTPAGACTIALVRGFY
jgi:hypothetical protein